MDKRLKNYDKYISNEIEKISDLSDSTIKARELLNYHNIQVRNFQHERLIHLLVTFFFATLLILCVGILYVPKGINYQLINNLLILMSAILLTVEIFYVKYYYYLENGTQKLYKYTDKLFEIINK